MKAGKKNKAIEVAVLLPDIRSAYNIGSIFRTCDAAGIRAIYLTGHSPCPTDRFNRPRKDIAKTALGAEKTISWYYDKSAIQAIKKLRADDFYIVAVEQTKDSVNYKDKSILKKLATKRKILFIFGNEVNGLAQNILKLADICVEIPMKGEKESLNVSVTAGVALFGMLGL